MTREPQWFKMEADDLLDKWAEDNEGMEYPEYLEKHLSDRGKQYWTSYRQHRKKMFDERLAV